MNLPLEQGEKRTKVWAVRLTPTIERWALDMMKVGGFGNNKTEYTNQLFEFLMHHSGHIKDYIDSTKEEDKDVI